MIKDVSVLGTGTQTALCKLSIARQLQRRVTTKYQSSALREQGLWCQMGVDPFVPA